MKNNILLSTILCFSITNILSAEVLEDITITTATKTQKSIDGVAATVEVILEKDIKKMGAESLKDILARVSGLNIQYGTFPSASSKSKSSISLRGMGANGTLFLIDGRRLSGEVKNPFDLDRIAASSIERIEIVKGPMSSLYGADAVGGVINIITKKPTNKTEINLALRYGQNTKGEGKNKNISFDLRSSKNKFKYSIYFNKTKTTPYSQKELANVMVKQFGGVNNKTKQKPSNLTPSTPSYQLKNLNDSYIHDVTYAEESDINTLGGRFVYDFSENTSLAFDFNAFEEKREGSYIGYFHPSNFSPAPGKKIPVFNIPVNTTDKNKRIDLALDLTNNINEDFTLKLKAYKSYYKKRNTTTAKYYSQMGYSSEEESASNGMNANVDIRTYETIINYFLNDNHILTSGIEKRDEIREASVFTQTPDMSEKKVSYKALYLQDEWQINNNLNAILGLRYDQVSNADNKTTFRLGLVENFSKLLNLRLNFAQGYRTPDIREMYINKQTPNGLQQGASIVNYNLKPELTNSYEIGLSGRNSDLSYNISLFFNQIKDQITQINTGSYYTFENLSKAETKGLEFSLNYDINQNLSSRFSWTELRTQNKETNKDLEFNPERTINLSLDYNLNKNLSFGIFSRYTSKQSYQSSNGNTIIDKKTNDFNLIDFRTNYKINKNFSMYAGINNIFDKKVDDILGSNLGTYIYSGLRLNF